MNTDLTPAVIEKIESMADKSKHSIITINNSTKRIIRFADGETEVVNESPVRKHDISCVEDIKPYLDYAREKLDAKPVVWIGNDLITITINDLPESTREDVSTLIFEHSAEFKLLNSLSDSQLTQGQLLRLVRVKLYDCFPSTDQRLRWITMLKTVSRESTVAQGTQSNYTTNRAEAEWPDFMELCIRIFEDQYLSKMPPHRVRVHVEVSADGRFELIPNVADMKAAVDGEIQYLTDHLRATASDYPIFRGQP